MVENKTLRLAALVLVGLVLYFPTHGSLMIEISTNRIRPGMSFASSQIDLQSLSGLAKLGPRSRFRQANGIVHISAKGVKRVRLVQTYGGYDVLGTSVEAELDAKEIFSGQMYGEVVRDLQKHIPDPRACACKWKHFLDTAISLEGLSSRDPGIQRRSGRRIIYVVSETSTARLAYEVKFFYKNDRRFSYPVYLFDACTGERLTSHDQATSFAPKDLSSFERPLHHERAIANGPLYKNRSTPLFRRCSISAVGTGGNSKIGRRTYNIKPYCLNVRMSGNICTMEGTYTKTIDNLRSTTRTKRTILSFFCTVGYSDGVNNAYGIANDAFYHGEVFGDFFDNKYNMRALPYKPRLVVHYSSFLENAYSDGTDTYYGDGRNVFYPLIGIDIVAHEIAHAITRRNSNLIYREMSGGINEAFSDITAVATRAFAEDTRYPDWTLGASVYKGRGALRYLNDPTLDGSSIKSIFRYRSGMGVHTSSGIFNHAFYRLVRTQRMNIFEAYKCFLDANLNLWKPTTNFFNGACNVMQAAYDNGYNHRKVRRAFRRVGIPLIFCWYAALSTTMFVGETREKILVSATRSPIIKVEIDLHSSNSTFVEVMADDKSTVHVLVGKDDEATQVIARGENLVSFENAFPQVYIKLSSHATVDVTVKMAVLNSENLSMV